MPQLNYNPLGINQRDKPADWYIIHGFRTTQRKQIKKFNPLYHEVYGGSAFKDRKFKLKMINYGWQGTLHIDKAMDAIVDTCPQGCNILAHSLGGVAAVTASIERGLHIRNLILVNCPLDSKIRFPPNINKIFVISSPGDWVVNWSRTYNKVIGMLFAHRRSPHQYFGNMGQVGYQGIDYRVSNFEVDASHGHSGVLKQPRMLTYIMSRGV
jgi:pimeloyl-ACP methyl ester carboxylesterase